MRGRDVNWDLRNYHDYAVYALVSGCCGHDVAPASFQSWFNPLPYLVPYALRHALPPMFAATVIAVLQALVVPVVLVLARELVFPGRGSTSAILAVLATVSGVTAAMALAEIGTSYADLPLAALQLGGLALLLRATAVPAGRDRAVRLLLSGAAVGLAAGLKLTGLLFLFGLGAAAILPWPGGWRTTIRATATIGAGAAIALLLAAGPWALHLWVTLGNPLFPNFNTVFRSASAIPSDFQDRRFLPAGLSDALRVPWAVASGRAPTAEVAFADPRVLAVLPLAAAAVFVGVLRVRSRRVPGPVATPPLARALVFGAVSYLVWLGMFAIERYAVPIEILAGMLVVLLAARLVPVRAALPVAAVCAILLLGATRPADWGHRPWSVPFRPVLPAPLREPASFLVVSHPVGYWVSILPPGSRFLLVERSGLATGGVLHARLLDGLDHAPGGRLRTLGEDAPMEFSTREQLRSLGVVVEPSCVHLGGLDGTPILSCAASRPGSRPLAATDLLPDVPVDMSDRGNGWPLLLDGWGTPAADGTPAIAADAVLLLRVPDQPEPRVLELTAATPAPDTLRVAVDGREAASWALAGAGRAATGGVCLPPRAAGPFRVRLRSGSVGLVLRQLRLRDAEPGECPA